MEIITTHINADFDSLGAMLGAKKLYPEAILVFPGSQEKNLRLFLENSDYPFGFLRTRHVDLERISRLIIVDTKSSSRIGIFAGLLNRPGISVHIYDHHPEISKTIHGDFECIREVGAATTILTELIREKELPLSREEATILGMGIYEDTAFLSSSATKPCDLRAVAWLLECGANLNVVSENVNRELSVIQVHILDDLLNSAEQVFINDLPVVISAVSAKDYTGELAILVHKMRDLENIDVLFVLVQMENRIHLIARSTLESVDVGLVTGKFGGGGHIYAASATVHNETLVQVREELIKILREEIRPAKCAVDIMTRPVRCVSTEKSIQEVKNLLLRYHLNTLVVIDRQEELAGIITRLTVDRALVHKMENVPVSHCMLSDIQTASPGDSLRKIRKLMLEQHQRFLPVVQGKKVKGVITRGDLLRIIHEDMQQHPKLPGERRSGERGRHKNLKNLLNERLSPAQLKIIQVVEEVVEELNLSAFLVGGVVRDLLLRVENVDLDVVIEEDGVFFARHLSRRVKGHFRSHEKFCTAVVVFPNGFKLDVATARTEFYEHPAAVPIVDISSIKQDLYRRDFTINALAVRVNKKGFGELIDFFGGQQDLKNRLIRVLHSLSFIEDPARVFRAVRFEKRLGFKIGSHTLTLLKNAVRQGFCEQLNGGRLLYELKMIFREVDPIPVIERMMELDLLKLVHPGIKKNGILLKRMKSVKAVLDWYHFLFLPRKPEQTIIYLMCLIQDLDAAEIDALCKRFSFSLHQKKIIAVTRKEYGRMFSILNRESDPPNSLIFDTLKFISLENLLFFMAVAETEKAVERISRYLATLVKVNIQINGDDLIRIGLLPGPDFRKIFREIHHRKLNGFLLSRKDQLEYVRKNYSGRRSKKE